MLDYNRSMNKQNQNTSIEEASTKQHSDKLQVLESEPKNQHSLMSGVDRS